MDCLIGMELVYCELRGNQTNVNFTFAAFFSLGEQHISGPQHRYGDQHCACSCDDSKGKSGEKLHSYTTENLESPKSIAAVGVVKCAEPFVKAIIYEVVFLTPRLSLRLLLLLNLSTILW